MKDNIENNVQENSFENKDNVVSEKNRTEEKSKKKKGNLKLLICVCCLIILIGLFIWSAYDNYIKSCNEMLPDLEKPVIYLYPENEMNLSLQIDDVNFTSSYPEYKNGWDIVASPDGTLRDRKGREYNYLYWEGTHSNYDVDMTNGFVVAKEDYVSFFENKLSYIGLSDKEACDFISYWLPICNKYDYTLIYFQKNYSDVVKKTLSVPPDNKLEVFVAFKGLNSPIDIPEQDLSFYDSFEREGFVMVEWGGTLLSDD